MAVLQRFLNDIAYVLECTCANINGDGTDTRVEIGSYQSGFDQTYTACCAVQDPLDDKSYHTDDMITCIAHLRNTHNQKICSECNDITEPSTPSTSPSYTTDYDNAYLTGVHPDLCAYTPSGKYAQGAMYHMPGTCYMGCIAKMPSNQQPYALCAGSGGCVVWCCSGAIGTVCHLYGTAKIHFNCGGYISAGTEWSFRGADKKVDNDITIYVGTSSGITAPNYCAVCQYISATTTPGYYATETKTCTIPSQINEWTAAGNLATRVGNSCVWQCATATRPSNTCCSFGTDGTESTRATNFATSYKPTARYSGVCFPAGYYNCAHIGVVDVSGIRTVSISNPTETTYYRICGPTGYYSAFNCCYTGDGLSTIDRYLVPNACCYIDNRGLRLSGGLRWCRSYIGESVQSRPGGVFMPTSDGTIIMCLFGSSMNHLDSSGRLNIYAGHFYSWCNWQTPSHVSCIHLTDLSYGTQEGSSACDYNITYYNYKYITLTNTSCRLWTLCFYYSDW